MPRAKDRATIIDVARAAGVSKSTVSLVLRGSPLVRSETAEAVQSAMRELGYVYNRSAANLRRARSNVVGMVINDLTNPFFAELAVGIESALQASGLIPMMANTHESCVRQADVLNVLREQDVSGIVISPARGTNPDTLEGFARAGLPVVQAMRRLPGARLASVAPDNTTGATEAMRHLLGLGYRRIAFLGGYRDMPVHRERIKGYEDALGEAGLTFDPDLVADAAPSRAGGVEAFDRVRRLAEPADAALCFNDVVAFGAMLCLRRNGEEAGRDFGIVGFDDLMESRHQSPALTTVAVDAAGLGERAAQMLLRMIESGSVSVEEQTTSVHLVVRESCGAGRGRIRKDVA